MNSVSELSVNMNALTFLFWIEAKEFKFLRFFTIIIVYCSIMASCPKVFQNWRENFTRPHFRAQAAQPVFCRKRIWNKLCLHHTLKWAFLRYQYLVKTRYQYLVNLLYALVGFSVSQDFKFKKENHYSKLGGP